jgi:hypothetical protein
MAEQLVIDLLIQDKSAMSIAQMRAEVKKLKSELTTLDPGSEKFAEAARRAAELTDNIDDAGEALNSMKGQGTLEGVNSSLGRVGEKIKNLDFDGVAKDISLMATSLGGLKLGDFTKGIESIGKALGKMATAILTNPIFLLAAAIAAVVAATYFLVKAVNEETDSERRNRLAREAVNDAMKEGKASAMEETIKLQSLLEVVNDHTLAEESRQGALDEMNGIMGTTLTLTEDVTEATEEYLDMLIKKSQADAIIKQMAEINNKLADGKAMMEEYGKGNWLQQGWDWMLRNANMGAFAYKSFENQANRTNEAAEDLKSTYTALEIQLKSLTEETSAYNKEADDSAKKQKDAAKAAEDAAKAAEKLRQEYEKLYKEGQSWYSKLLYDSANSLQKIEVDYGKMWDAADLYYRKNIISYEEYVNAYKLINKNYHKAIEDEQNKHLKHVEATDEQRLEESKDSLLNYLDELMKADNLDDEAIKKILARREQAMYDYYDGLLKLEETKADEDSIRTEEELRRIDAIIAKRDEYVAAAIDGDKKITQSSEEVRLKRINDNLATLENYKAVSDVMAGISTSFFDFLGNLAEGNDKKQKKIQKAAFKVNKATSAVETGINTTQAIMKIAATIPPPFSVPLQIATGIQGALAVAAILAKKFPEDGNADTGGSSPATTATTAGTTPSIANMYGGGGGTPTTFQSLSPMNQPIQKVVVLESDISSAQQNVAKVGVQSTF